MNHIIIGGKMSSSMKNGSYPNGTKLLSFQLKESHKGGMNRFNVVVTGENNIQYCKKHFRGGDTVFVKGNVIVKNYPVKNAVVLVDGRNTELYVKDFIIKAYEVNSRPFGEK